MVMKEKLWIAGIIIFSPIILLIIIISMIIISIINIKNTSRGLNVIKGILDRSLSMGYTHISSDAVQFPRKTVYTFKDENDVYFNVFYSYRRHYDSPLKPERLYICNYHQIIFSHYLEKIENAFLKHLSRDEFSLEIGDSAQIRSNVIGKLYDFRTYRYTINISSGDLESAKNKIIAAVKAAIKAAPDWQYITRNSYDNNTHNHARTLRQFNYSRFPGINLYYHGAFIGRAHFNPDDATYFDVTDGEAAIYFIADWVMERNLREKGLLPPS
jgi:hypothetical protein